MIKTAYTVSVGGADRTASLRPLCEKISVSKSAGKASDTCSMTFADPNGSMVLPQERKPLEISINGIIAFRGFVDDVDYDFNDGKKIIVSGSSIDSGGKGKETDLKSKDNATFSDVANEWGKAVGLSIFVSGSITSVVRPFWILQNESFHSWAEDIAGKLGATYKAIGDQAFFVGRNEGLSASGKPLTPINAVYGANIKGGNISPIVTRPKFSETGSRYFDQDLGEYVVEKIKTAASDVEAIWFSPNAEASKENAKQLNTANSKAVEREQGDGHVVILGDASAEPEAEVNVSGIRPGIDGTYRADSIDHDLSDAGFITKIQLKHPTGGAGVDKR